MVEVALEQVAAEAEALLVDDGWRAPEPVAMAGYDPVHDRDSAPQRTLFSWAEIMAGEPDKPPPTRRDEAPTLSLIEWALQWEQ